jgi:outer membrane protein
MIRACTSLLLSAVLLNAQTTASQVPRIGRSSGARWYEQGGNPWAPKPVTQVSFANSSRIYDLIRAGNLYLSLRDAIALALENNLDIEFQRFTPAIAGSDVLRAKGGGTLRGPALTILEPPAGLGGPISALLNTVTAVANTVPVSSSIATNITDLAAIVPTETAVAVAPLTAFSLGSAIPLFDPFIASQFNATHTSTPQTSIFLTGTNVLVTRTLSDTTTFTQAFSTGTLVTANFTDTNQAVNSIRSTFSPYTNAALSLTVTQPLLRGFGISVNRRFIRIANNDVRMSDLVFRQQVIDTVAGIIRLYWDLVSLTQDVGVKQQSLALAQKLYDDNALQVKQGTMAPIELVRAQALVAASRQDLANAQGFAREQELIMKNVLTRRGTADPVIRDARIVPTTPIPEPGAGALPPLEELLETAFRNRPDLGQAAIQIDNAQISLEGSRNALLPDIAIFGTMSNNGLAGQINPLNPAQPGSPFFSPANPTFVGGIGTVLSQIFRRNFPNYGGGILLTLPIRNRIAQADYARDEIELRRSQIRQQQLVNQVRLEVEDATIALERTRAAYEAAVQAAELQQQSLEAEQLKFSVGLSTTFLVSQYQTFVAQARSTEVAARGAYAKARTALERALGQTIENNGITIDEAYAGRVK